MILEDFEENISENECKFLLSKFGAGAKSDGHKDGEGVASGPDSIKTLRQQVTDLGAYKTSARRIAQQIALGRVVNEVARDDTLLIIATMQFPRRP